jgi:hypothetical protein
VYKGGKNDSGLTPLFGVPNTNLDTYDKRSGRFKSRRKYGNDGNARVDLDKAHSNKYPFDHAHDINTNNDLPRSEYHRPLTRQERREINKASKKRRFWKND